MTATSAAVAPRLGIIISMFPELHETFILRELVALERRGVEFDIYSLQFPRDPITIDDAKRLSQRRTTYSRLITKDTLGALFRMALRRPLRLAVTVARVIGWGLDRPGEMIKNLAVLPVTLHFGELGAARGTTHWHGHWANVPTTACWYLKQLCDQTFSAAIHGEDIFSPNRFLEKKLTETVFTVTCSAFFCRHLQHELGLPAPDRVHLNYHGLEPEVMERAHNSRFKLPADDGVVRLISIGRLVPTKGHDTLIRACGLLARELELPFELQLIGSGPMESDLKALAAAQGVGDAVVFRGKLAYRDVLRTLERSDAFCLAPRLLPGHPPDGIPNVIAEAMALRVPVVSTRVGAIPELVDDGQTGHLVAVDDAAGIARAVERIVRDPQSARRLSDNAYQKVRELFDGRRNIDQLLGYFRHYLPGRVLE